VKCSYGVQQDGIKRPVLYSHEHHARSSLKREMNKQFSKKGCFGGGGGQWLRATKFCEKSFKTWGKIFELDSEKLLFFSNFRGCVCKIEIF
jgi:hypothetical protein